MKGEEAAAAAGEFREARMKKYPHTFLGAWGGQPGETTFRDLMQDGTFSVAMIEGYSCCPGDKWCFKTVAQYYPFLDYARAGGYLNRKVFCFGYLIGKSVLNPNAWTPQSLRAEMVALKRHYPELAGVLMYGQHQNFGFGNATNQSTPQTDMATLALRTANQLMLELWPDPPASAAAKTDDFSIGIARAAAATSPTPPFLNVIDFGAQGDGVVDDTAAVQTAIDAIARGGRGGGGGILVFPPGRYLISETLNTSGAGNHLMGSGSGIFSGPELLWVGAVNGTLFAVQKEHSGFRMEGFYLRGNQTAGVLMHVMVKAHPAGSTHNPQLSHMMFNGYTRYGMILGEDSETELGDGELSDAVFNHLRFDNTVYGTTGILINAENMEIGSFYTLRFDGAVKHKHHIFHRSGMVEIYGLVSTRAFDYAIYAQDTISVHGWRSEDPLLYYTAASGFGSPVSLTEVLQRGTTLAPGTPCADVIVWREQGYVTFGVHDSTLEGNVVLGPTIPQSSSFTNIKWKNNGQVLTDGPSNASFVEITPSQGLIKLQAPSPEIMLTNQKGSQQFLASGGGLSLNGMLQMAVGDDVASAARVNLTGAGPGSGNLVKVTGAAPIRYIGELPSGTMITLYFERALTVAVGGNLQLAGPFVAEVKSTLMLVSIGSEWLELSRSLNQGGSARPAATKTDDDATVLPLFPRPVHLGASGAPVQLAHNVTVRAVGTGCTVDLAPVCHAVLIRYQQLLRIKLSGNRALSSGASSATTISTVTVHVASPIETLGPDTNESYNLRLEGGAVNIVAPTIYGARAGLETFAQLVADHPDRAGASSSGATVGGWGGWVAASSVHIVDAPTFSYRGFMIDTGRHFLPLPVIKKIITAMSMFKLNVLHWHLVDSESYPVKGKAVPELAQQSAFGISAVYTTEDLTEVVDFARSHGVRVLPEIEMPGHGACRSKAFPELNLSSCPGVLDPTLDATYDFLVRALSDIAAVFPEPTLFLGGDEVDFHCFMDDPAVVKWMVGHCAELHCCGENSTVCSKKMLSYFFKQVHERVMPKLPVLRRMGVWLADSDNADRPGCATCGWNAVDVAALPPSTLFNVYQSLPTARLPLRANRTTVVSIAFGKGSVAHPWLGRGGWYLDQKPTFETVWSLDFMKDLGCESSSGGCESLVGGEACSWGSSLNGQAGTIDVDIFSGGMAAVAERLWSNPPSSVHAAQVESAAAAAKARYHALVCHWSLWGVPTYDRAACTSWPCSQAGGNLSVTPVDTGTCASAWSEPPSEARDLPRSKTDDVEMLAVASAPLQTTLIAKTDDAVSLPPVLVISDNATQPFFDDALIASGLSTNGSTGLRRSFNAPVFDQIVMQPALLPAAPWEVGFALEILGTSIVRVPGPSNKLRMYYTLRWAGLNADGVPLSHLKPTAEMFVIGIAESEDGVVWAKPLLDGRPFASTLNGANVTRSNILGTAQECTLSHTSTIWVEPSAPASSRWWAVSTAAVREIVPISVSADGIVWRRHSQITVPKISSVGAGLDSQPMILHDPGCGCHALFTRVDGSDSGSGSSTAGVTGISAQCQAKLDAFCNSNQTNAGCLDPTRKAFGALVLPMVGLYSATAQDHNPKWRCFSHLGVIPTPRPHWNTSLPLPNGFPGYCTSPKLGDIYTEHVTGQKERKVRRANIDNLLSGNASVGRQAVVIQTDSIDDGSHHAALSAFIPVSFYGATAWIRDYGGHRAYFMAPVRYWHWQGWPGMAKPARAGEGGEPATYDVALAVSRDGWNYSYLGDRQPFARPTRDGSVGQSQVWVAPPVVVGDDELYFVTRANMNEDGQIAQIDGSTKPVYRAEIALGRLRRDGAVSIDGRYGVSQRLTTKVLNISGAPKELFLNVDASGGGSVSVTLLTPAGEHLLGPSHPIVHSSVHSLVRWSGNKGFEEIWNHQPFRLEIAIEDAKLYSFRLSTSAAVTMTIGRRVKTDDKRCEGQALSALCGIGGAKQNETACEECTLGLGSQLFESPWRMQGSRATDWVLLFQPVWGQDAYGSRYAIWSAAGHDDAVAPRNVTFRAIRSGSAACCGWPGGCFRVSACGRDGTVIQERLCTANASTGMLSLPITNAPVCLTPI